MRLVLAAVILGGSFGSASASVESIEDGVMVIEMTVEVVESAESVVAHLTFEGDDELTLPLLDRGDGTFGLRTELEAKNYFVVFETIGEEGERSAAVSLADLGVDLPREQAATTTTLEDDGLSEDSERLLWLAVALGAASLSVLAFWVLAGRDEDEEPAAGDRRGDETAEEE